MYCSDNFRNVTVKQYQFSEFTLHVLKFDTLCTFLTTRMHLLLKFTNGIARRHNKMPKWDILWFDLLLNINTNNPSSIFTQTALNPEYMPEINMPEVLQPRPPDPCPCKVLRIYVNHLLTTVLLFWEIKSQLLWPSVTTHFSNMVAFPCFVLILVTCYSKGDYISVLSLYCRDLLLVTI